MKILLRDSPFNNYDIFTEDNPYCKVRLLFEDDGNIFVYYSDDINNQIYINQIVDKKHHPHIFFISNFKEIEDSDQFKYYYDHINNNYNFQALHKGELIDGEDWQPTFVMQSEDKNV